MSARKQNFAAFFAIAFCCLMPQWVHAQFERPPEVMEPYQAGLAAHESGEHEAAVKHFDQAAQFDDGTFPELYFARGESLRELEDFPLAMSDYTKAINANDRFALAYNGRGVCLLEQQNIELALNDFRTAAELDRTNGSIAANLGDLLVNNFQNPVQAMQYLDRAIDVDPEDAESYRNRGWAHTMLRETEEAIADINKAIEIDPADYITYQRLASINLMDVEYQAGIDALTLAIKYYLPEKSSDPSIYLGGYLQLADTKSKFAKEKGTPPEQSEALYKQIIADADVILDAFPDRFPESGLALHMRGMALRMQSQYAEAIIAFTDAILMIPSGRESNYISEAYRTRGICWFYQGQISLARGDFKEAISLNADDPLPYLWMGYTYAEEENYRKAIESYGEATAKNPTFSLAFVNRGIAYMQLRDYSKAVDNFNQAIRAEPTEPMHFYKRGMAHEHLEEHQKALDSYTLALLRSDNLAIAHQGAARALRALGRNSLAEIHESKANAIP